MKVLIMEDEMQTRQGIAEGVPWQTFGITEVYTAKNGEMGYEMARDHRPDIILSDIRMPRMDGITAAKRLRRVLPGCSLIFISAYPEKQYFKEAIRLKSVSFVEKPVDMGELENVLREAVEEQSRGKLQEEEREKAFLYSAQQLVTRLNRNRFESREACRRELMTAGIQADEYRLFATILVRYYRGADREDEARWNYFCESAEKKALLAPARVLAGQKQSDLIVFHLFMRREEELFSVRAWLKKETAQLRRIYILEGSTQRSYMKLHESYNDAVLQVNRAFYLPYGELVSGGESDIVMTLDLGGWMAEFTERLRTGRLQELPELLESYRQQILGRRKVHYTVIQEFYLYLYGELDRYMEQNARYAGEQRDAYTGALMKYGNFEEYHGALLAMLENMQSAGDADEDDIVARIRKYVAQNYRNPWLSIGEIAEAVKKSVSHVCVVFKRETGETLNQYLTETRMEAAKAYLDNPRNSVKAVARECGYTDSSYFTRAFKKYTGKTPSEYRGEEK